MMHHDEHFILAPERIRCCECCSMMSIHQNNTSAVSLSLFYSRTFLLMGKAQTATKMQQQLGIIHILDFYIHRAATSVSGT